MTNEQSAKTPGQDQRTAHHGFTQYILTDCFGKGLDKITDLLSLWT